MQGVSLRASGLAVRLFNLVSHYRAALVFERWICAAVPIMPHYVNIAWGNFFGHVFLPESDGAALCFLAFTLSINTPKANKTMCCKRVGVKSMTEKITEGHGPGELRGLVFVLTESLKADGLTVLLIQLLLLDCL